MQNQDNKFAARGRRTRWDNSDMGFTLLELLVVMAIVGILAAIAVPQYDQYKRRGFDLRAQSDLYNAAVAEEAYFLDNEEYLSCSAEACLELPGIAALSPGVELAMLAGETTFTGTSSHPKGSGRTFQWDSEFGGLVAEGSAEG